jgi:6-phosphofructokinase 1
MKGNCLVAQSGGPTSAINASLAGVFLEMSKSPDVGKVYGGINGIQGVIEEKLLELGPVLDTESNIALPRQTPSASLGSCRFKMKSPADQPVEYTQIFNVFEKFDIRYFIYIGGNDSMDTVYKLGQYAKDLGREMVFMGVPKTIDNDLVCTDHTPGFGSCAKYVATSIHEIAQDNMVYDMDCAVVVEVMGRDAGWISLAAGLARDSDGQPHCDMIYPPEKTFITEKFLEDLAAARARKRQVLIAVSEGIKDDDGGYISDTGITDAFGHQLLGGVGTVLSNLIRDHLNIKVRAIELSLLQRCAAHYASAIDLKESEALGRFAAKGALEGQSAKMAAIRRLSDKPYATELFYADVREVANAVKTVPDDFLNAAGNLVSEKGLDYLLPLIAGTNEIILDNGIPAYLNLASIYSKKV